MYIEKFQIINFKLFRNITISFNKDLNVFTGTNNSGKSTILEALSLWQEIFNKLIIRDDNKFIFNKDEIYFDYKELQSIRSSRYEGVFYNFEVKNTIILNATIKNDTDSINVSFSIKSDYKNIFIIGLENKNKFNLTKFNQFFNLNKTPNKPEPIFLTCPASIDNFKPVEKFQTYVNIDKQIRNGNSISVLRNRIHDLKTDEKYFNSFKRDLYYILNKDTQRADMDVAVKSDRSKDSIAKIDIWIKNLFVDIFQLGSGTIQIIELLLSLYRKNDYADLNLIMLDEPDKHIHRDIQIYLFQFIKKHIKNNKNQQFFVTTHNESLIRSLDPTELFHIENKGYNDIEIKPIINDNINYPKKGFQPTPHIKILESLGAASGLDLINAIEADILILTEGKSDAKYIQEIYNINKNKQSIIFLSFGGVSNIFRHIKSYKYLLETIKGSTNLWDKAILIFDKDIRTDQQRKDLQQAFITKIKIETLILKSYTLEATLFSNIDILSKLLSKYFKINYSKEVSVKEIRIKLEILIGTKINEKQKILKNFSIKDKKHDLWKKYTDQIKSTRRLTESFLEIKNIFNKKDDMLWNEFTEYYKKNLNINNFHKIIDKNDVFDILNNIAHKFNISIDENLFFSDIIDLAKYDLWFDDWTDICNLIGNKPEKQEDIIEKIDANFKNLFDTIEKDGLKEVVKLIFDKNKPTREYLLKVFSKSTATFDRYIKELKEKKIIDTNKDDEYFFIK